MTYAGNRRLYEPAPMQTVLDTLDQGVSVFDGELRLVAWNRRFVELLAVPEQLAGQGTRFEELVRFFAQRDGLGAAAIEELVEQRLRAAAQCRRFYTERTTPEGRILAAQTNPLPDGGFVTVFTDISERGQVESLTTARTIELEARVNQRVLELRNANEELRHNLRRLEEASAARAQSEARLRLITDAVPAAIGYVDEERRLIFANRRFAEMFTRTSEQVIGHGMRELFGHKIMSELAPHIDKAFHGQAESFEHNYTMPDGRSGTTRNILIPERADDGQVLGLFVLSLDVTEEKRAERALNEAQKMSAIGQLAGGLAHDFNNLLTVIVGNLSSLEDHIDPALVREYVKPAVRASYRGVDITRRLLAFARQQSLEPLPVDVSAAVAATAQLLRRSLPSNITIHCDGDGDGWAALADPAQLENAIVNLALNARDAMNPDGGVLTIRIASTTISDGSDERLPDGDYVSISVSDTGAGIAPEIQARIFEPFFTTKPFGTGSGLGLSMVFGFARQSGGDIRLVSEVAKGTRVTLLLPRANGVVSVTAPPEDEETPVTGSSDELVLLVEDDPEVRRSVRRQLLELGYRVLEARDGDDAEVLLQSAPEISIMVSDVIMPGSKNGLALADRVRRAMPGLRIVLISGSTMISDYVHDHDWLNESMVLHKPFGREELARALARNKERA
jgi:PAS domain S-box-containing protein